MDDDAVLDELLAKFGHRADTYEYFFDRIDSPQWIEPLRARGFFREPRSIERLEGGYVRFPVWPESRALARLADQDEATVIDTILACPDSDNPRVHDDFTDAALRVSPERGAQLVPLITKWLRNPYKLLMPMKAGKLLTRLAEAGLTDPTQALATELFRLELVDEVMVSDELIAYPPRFHARFDDWEYKSVVEENAVPYVRALGLPAIGTLCGALHSVLLAEGERAGGQPRDSSYIWRPSIEEHEQNIDREPRSFLVTAIREGADLLIESERVSVSAVVAFLEAERWDVFDRLAMYVASRHADHDPAPAVRMLLRRDLFDAYQVSNEYCALTRVALALASERERATWTRWVADGPDEAAFVKVRREGGDPEPTPEELKDRADAWRWHRIAFAPDEALDEEGRHLKAELSSRFDDPTPFPIAVYTSYGTPSPLAADEAGRMSMSELADYASHVAPTERRFESPEEGVALLLEKQAQERPSQASKELHRFKTLKPLYMRSLISGLREAARNGSPDISWPDALEVAGWVLDQPREIDGGSGGIYADLDPGWLWTISAIADLLEEGLRRRLPGAEVRDKAWQLLAKLVVQPDDNGVESDDPGTDSLNRIRGKALHGVIMYADWLFEMNRSDGEAPPRRLETNSPEVVPLLDDALSPDLQPTAAVRAVFGMRAANLMKLDPEWLRSRSERVFSVDQATGRFDDLGQAAWHSYLKYSRTFVDVLQVLRPQYELAVSALSEGGGEAQLDVKTQLADHVMVMYWHGQLGESPFDDSLLADFWDRADKQVRKRALTFVGHSLRDVRDSLDEDIAERLMRLWDGYVEYAKNDPTSDFSELQAFGWWVLSQALEFSWLVPRAVEVLELARGLDSPGEVMSVLTQAPAPELKSATKVLRLIAVNDREGWGLVGRSDEVSTLLRSALQSDDAQTREEGRTTTDVLIARGFVEFRELLG